MLNPQITWVSLIAVIGASQALFLAVVTALKIFRHTQAAKRYAFTVTFFLLLIVATALLEHFLDVTQYFVLVPHLILLTAPLNLLLGPLLFLLLKVYLDPANARYQHVQLWHALPALLGFVALIPLLMQVPAGMKLDFYYNDAPLDIDLSHPLLMVSALLSVPFSYLPSEGLSILIYSALAGHLLWQRRLSFATKSFLFSIHPAYLWFITAVMLVSSMALMLQEVYLTTLGLDESFVLNILFSLISFCLFLTVYMNLVSWQPSVQHEVAKLGSKYQKSSLTTNQKEKIAEVLEQHMQASQAYLNAEFRLPDLAKQTGFSANHISQTLNENLGLGFRDYVSNYRIEVAKTLLSNPNNDATIVRIAYEAGFNSRTTFYAAFKKHTGVTPTEFRKQSQSRLS